MKKIELSVELLAEANIPQKFWPFDLSTFGGNPKAKDLVVQYIKKAQDARVSGVGIFLCGCAQTFKTFLGTYILKCVLHRGYSVRYTSLPDIAREHFVEGDTNYTIRQLYGSVDFVFIDDLIGQPHKGETQALARVLQVRATIGLPTIMAAVLPLSEMAEHYGDLVAKQLGIFREINCNSDSAAFTVHRIQEEAKSKIWED